MSLFKGAGVALITPFNEDNSVNYEMLKIGRASCRERV